MARNQTTWNTVYSQAQKDAIIRAVIADGNTYRQALRAAEAGELGVPRFTMSINYVGKLVRAARHQHDPTQLAQPENAARAIETAQSRMLSLLLRSIDRWNKNAEAGQTDWPEHGRLMRALKEHSHHTKPGKPGETEQHDNTSTPGPDVLRQLLQHANQSNGLNPETSTTTVSSARDGSSEAESPPVTGV